MPILFPSTDDSGTNGSRNLVTSALTPAVDIKMTMTLFKENKLLVDEFSSIVNENVEVMAPAEKRTKRHESIWARVD